MVLEAQLEKLDEEGPECRANLDIPINLEIEDDDEYARTGREQWGTYPDPDVEDVRTDWVETKDKLEEAAPREEIMPDGEPGENLGINRGIEGIYTRIRRENQDCLTGEGSTRTYQAKENDLAIHYAEVWMAQHQWEPIRMIWQEMRRSTDFKIENTPTVRKRTNGFWISMKIRINWENRGGVLEEYISNRKKKKSKGRKARTSERANEIWTPGFKQGKRLDQLERLLENSLEDQEMATV